jgi:hypothetical protein
VLFEPLSLDTLLALVQMAVRYGRVHIRRVCSNASGVVAGSERRSDTGRVSSTSLNVPFFRHAPRCAVLRSRRLIHTSRDTPIRREQPHAQSCARHAAKRIPKVRLPDAFVAVRLTIRFRASGG